MHGYMYIISGENINPIKSISTTRLLVRIWKVDAQNVLRICSTKQLLCEKYNDFPQQVGTHRIPRHSSS